MRPEIRALRVTDELAVLRALQDAFDLPADATLLAPGVWRRRYFGNPAGTRAQLAALPDGRVIAQYAGLPQGAWLEGERATFTQGVDSIAVPGAGRTGLGSLFVRVGRQFAEVYGGPRIMGDPFMWGYPVREAWRIGRALLGYETMRSQPALVGAVERIVPRGSAAVEVHEETAIPVDLDVWFESHRRRYAAICDRTRAALEWRYAAHPAVHYRIAIARSGGAICGLAVGRELEFEGARRFALLDWLVEPDARGALLAWARDAARSAGLDELYAWLPIWCDDFLALQVAGFRVHPTSRVLVGRSYEKHRPVEWYADNWFMTLGDTDFA